MGQDVGGASGSVCALPDPVPTWLDVGTQGDGSACGNYASCDRWCPGGSSERHPYQKATAGQQVRTRTSEPPKNPGPGLQQPRSPPAGPGGLRACGRPRGGAPELGSPRGGPNPQKPLREPSEAPLPGRFLPAWGRARSQGPLECLQTRVGARPQLPPRDARGLGTPATRPPLIRVAPRGPSARPFVPQASQ